MIQANELRIGNWVYLVDDESEDSPFLKRITSIDTRDAEFYEPIPLTPEILEKAGFVKDEDRWQPNHKGWTLLTLEGFDLIINPENGSISKFWDTDDNWYSWSYPNIEYVHKLQNLYFCLCGTELEINLL